MSRFLGPLEARKMRREAGQALARKGGDAPAEEREPFEAEFARATKAVRAYRVGFGALALAAVAGGAFWYGQTREQPLDSEDARFLDMLRARLIQFSPLVTAQATKLGDGRWRLQLSDAEVRRTVQAMVGETVTLVASIDFPNGSGGRIGYENLSLEGDVAEIRRRLAEAGCHVRVMRQGAPEAPIVEPIPMSFIFDPVAEAKLPPDFPREVCQATTPTPKTSPPPSAIPPELASTLARDELETGILLAQPLVVQVDVDTSNEALLQFSLQRHPTLFSHKYFLAVNAFQSIHMGDERGERRRLDMGFYKKGDRDSNAIGARPIPSPWVHDMFLQHRGEAEVVFQVGEVKDAFRTDAVKLEFTPRALAWYAEWKKMNPSPTEGVELFQTEVEAVKKVLAAQGLTIRVRDVMHAGTMFFSYEIILPQGFPKTERIQSLLLGGDDAQTGIFVPYGKLAQIAGTLVDTHAQDVTQVLPATFAERFFGNTVHVNLSGPMLSEELPDVKFTVDKHFSPKAQDAVKKADQVAATTLSLRAVLTRLPLAMKIGVAPDGRFLHLDPTPMADNPLFLMSGLSSIYLRYARQTDDSHVEYVDIAAFQADGKRPVLAPQTLSTEAGPYLGKFSGMTMQALAHFKLHGQEMTLELTDPKFFAVQLDERLQ